MKFNLFAITLATVLSFQAPSVIAQETRKVNLTPSVSIEIMGGVRAIGITGGVEFMTNETYEFLQSSPPTDNYSSVVAQFSPLTHDELVRGTPGVVEYNHAQDTFRTSYGTEFQVLHLKSGGSIVISTHYPDDKTRTIFNEVHYQLLVSGLVIR